MRSTSPNPVHISNVTVWDVPQRNVKRTPLCSPYTIRKADCASSSDSSHTSLPCASTDESMEVTQTCIHPDPHERGTNETWLMKRHVTPHVRRKWQKAHERAHEAVANYLVSLAPRPTVQCIVWASHSQTHVGAHDVGVPKDPPKLKSMLSTKLPTKHLMTPEWKRSPCSAKVRTSDPISKFLLDYAWHMSLNYRRLITKCQTTDEFTPGQTTHTCTGQCPVRCLTVRPTDLQSHPGPQSAMKPLGCRPKQRVVKPEPKLATVSRSERCCRANLQLSVLQATTSNASAESADDRVRVVVEVRGGSTIFPLLQRTQGQKCSRLMSRSAKLNLCKANIWSPNGHTSDTTSSFSICTDFHLYLHLSPSPSSPTFVSCSGSRSRPTP